MIPYHTTLGIPPKLAPGLAAGIFEIDGGNVVMAGSRKMVTWLRPMADQAVKGAVAKPLLGGLSALASAPLAAKVGLVVVAVGTVAYLGYRIGKWAERRKAHQDTPGVKPGVPVPGDYAPKHDEAANVSDKPLGPLTDDPVLAAAFGFGARPSPRENIDPAVPPSRRSPVEEPT